MIKVYYSKEDKKTYTFKQVFDFLRDHLQNVEELYCEESVSEQDTMELCQLLANPGKANLRTLSLPSNDLNINFAERIACVLSINSTIKKLDLRRNLLGHEGLKLLIQPLLTNNSTLKVLILENNRLSHKAGADLALLLRENTNIEELHIGNNNIGVKGIKVISPQVGRTLRKLHLAGNSLKSRGVKLLAKSFEGNRNHHLQFLDLSNNQMGSQGMSALSEWLLVHHETQLKRLWLGCNDFGPGSGLLWSSIFEYNSTLTEVRLGGNQLGNDGIVALSEGIKNNHSLQKIDLDWNQISDIGAVALATALRTNGALRAIDLSGNQIFQRGSIALAQALPYNVTLKQLNMADNLMDDESAKAFAESLSDRHCVLEKLQWERNPRMSLSGIKMLENSAHYRDNLKQWFTYRFIEKIENNQMDSLNWMSKKYIGDLEINRLSNILCNGKNIDSLTTVYLGGDNITSTGSEALSEWIRRSDCCLKQLFFRGTLIGDAGARAIAEALESNVSLQVLVLTGCNITSQGATSLGLALMENETLHRLNLANNKIGVDGLLAIIGGIQHSKSVVALNVMANGITVSRESDLWDLIASSAVKELSLRNNKINDDVIIQFLFSLRDKCYLEILDLAENEISEKGLWLMKKMLKTFNVKLIT